MPNVPMTCFDFSACAAPLAARTGWSGDRVEAALADMETLLAGLREQPAEPMPMTADADEALHMLLEDGSIADVARALFGEGAEIGHDPTAYGTPAFAAAWESTRRVYGRRGVTLPADYAATSRDDRRAAAACWIWIAIKAA